MNFEKVTFTYGAYRVLAVDIILGVLHVKKVRWIDDHDGELLTFVQNVYVLFFGVHVLAMMQHFHGVEVTNTCILCVSFDEETHVDFIEVFTFYQHIS